MFKLTTFWVFFFINNQNFNHVLAHTTDLSSLIRSNYTKSDCYVKQPEILLKFKIHIFLKKYPHSYEMEQIAW